jgi:hypothetical protein
MILIVLVAGAVITVLAGAAYVAIAVSQLGTDTD